MRPRRSLVILTVLTVLTVLTAGCGSNPTAAPTVAPATQAATPAVSAPPATPSAVPSKSPRPSVEPSAPASASPGAIGLQGFTLDVAPSDTAAWSAITWRKLSPDDPLGWVTSITRWQGGYVALGRQLGNTTDAGTATAARTPVWVSTEGLAWTPLDPMVFGPDTLILGVAAVPGGLAALSAQAGSNGCDPGDPFDGCFGAVPPVQSWTSADGLSWTAHSGPFDGDQTPWFGAVGSTLFAMQYGKTAFEGAISTDGVTWTALPTDALPPSYTADSPAVFGTPAAIMLAGGGNLAGGGGSLRTSIPRSVDGQHWTSVRLPFTTPGVAESVDAIYVGRSGLLADGHTAETPGQDLWWRSADGASWSAVTGFPPLGARKTGAGAGTYPNGSLAGDGTRIVAYRDTGKAAAWASFDGADWQRLTMHGDQPLDATLTVLPMGVLAISGTGAWFGSPS